MENTMTSEEIATNLKPFVNRYTLPYMSPNKQWLSKEFVMRTINDMIVRRQGSSCNSINDIRKLKQKLGGSQ